LEKLIFDPDLRVRTEVWNTLEKLGEISFPIQMQFLMDPDKGLRRKAANLLMLQTEKDYVPDLIEIFEKEQADKPLLLSVIGKVGGREAKEFLEDVALGQNKSILSLSKKQKEELKLSALEFLQKIGDEKTKGKLEEFLKEGRKGFKSLLGKDKIQKTVEQVLNHLKKTLN
jgi:HEAT repeat protein